MATLQAARASVLGLPEEMAKSWGLNRAIFYAAAKRGFKERKPPVQRTWDAIESTPIQETREAYFLGDEMAYKSEEEGKTYFTIGGELQTPRSFEAQIERRFGATFRQAWEEAVQIVKSFDKWALLSQKEFYEAVYKPRRDELAAKWTEMAASSQG